MGAPTRNNLAVSGVGYFLCLGYFTNGGNSPMHLSEALRSYQLWGVSEYAPDTLDPYLSALKALCTFLMDPEMSNITETDLQRFG
jgi:hypothetical protein